ncbi:fibrinogen-like protein 1 [Sabethes cyaneus]|uniref:fibrinogen-like protein 1 n=1 Tax=Sabethes cyaneus TaxID=53552 RepID=UPI00237DB4A8|nr:fibrinogen-like protein 1 [Sabethes cyaneus]
MLTNEEESCVRADRRTAAAAGWMAIPDGGLERRPPTGGGGDNHHRYQRRFYYYRQQQQQPYYNDQLIDMFEKFVPFAVLVAVVEIFNTSFADNNETNTNSSFGCEQQCPGVINSNSNIESLKKTVEAIETLVTKQVRHISTLEEEIIKFSLSGARNLPQTCADISDRQSGLYRVQPQPGFSDAFEVYCDQQYEGGGWLVIQNRYDGSVRFDRESKEYEAGFGNLRGEFWLGLTKIHELTYVKPHELHIILEDFDGKIMTAQYDRFMVGGLWEGYVLSSLGNFSGNAGDSLKVHAEGQSFRTIDNWGNCDAYLKSGWWYNNCGESNLNGAYPGSQKNIKRWSKMYWNTFRGEYYGLKRSRMMIRVISNV